MTTDRTTTEHNREQREKERPGMIDTMIHLGTATTNLALDQVGNALSALVHPGKAIDHVKDTLKNLSDAMNDSAGSARHSDNSAGHPQAERASDMRGASDGKGYVATEPVATSFADERRPAGNSGGKVRAQSKINHRKA